MTVPLPPSPITMAFLASAMDEIMSLDPNPFYEAANVFLDVPVMLTEVGQDIATRARRLTSDQGGAQGWTGEGAEAFTKVVQELVEFLGLLAETVQRKAEPTRGAGDDILELQRNFMALLEKNSTAGGGERQAESRTPAVPAEPKEPESVMTAEMYLA
ncbi:hypothetical protein [Streptomyces sp. NPDC000410]|uniref:hypothetical protein n=1 Tax=Streptomyces sp. NPDC000410 TaxID=3154254 RepID=UPI00331A53E6